MNRAICLYLHVHQPFRVKPYSLFDIGEDHDYFGDNISRPDADNRQVLNKVAEKSYLPTNKKLLELLHTYPDFALSLSVSGVALEQFERWRPDVLSSFQDLVSTGRVEIVAETYYHSLSFFYSKNDFVSQVQKHAEIVQRLFNVRPQVFRNTELSYNNELAQWADDAGYKGIITEGWDDILGWQSPNYVYKPIQTNNISLLLKNYKLSDDIAFRFSNKNWSEWPLTTEKFVHWLGAIPDEQPLVNLFMDYETFGEHQWEETGIFAFLENLPAELTRQDHQRSFMTLSQAIDAHKPVGELDIPQTITWADTERDLTAWTGNAMQQEALQAIYSIEDAIHRTHNPLLLDDWRKLQISDHFYYMCTKWFSDGDVHAYFSPYESPYDAFIAYMNAVKDLKMRLMQEGY